MGFSLDAWNVETVTLTDADGNTARVLHRPVTTGWKAKRATIALELSSTVPPPPAAGAEQSAVVDWWKAAEKANKGAVRDWEDFARDMLGDLLVGTRDMLDAEGNAIEPDALIAYLSKLGPKDAPAAPLIALASTVMESGVVGAEGND